MTTELHVSQVDRREFLVTAAIVGGGMAISVLPANEAAAQAVHANPWQPPMPGGTEINPWIVIGTDNSITVGISQSEMGQNVFTSNAMMICEELECDWSKVRAVYVDVNRHFRQNLVYGRLATSASLSVTAGRPVYQQAGASARERLRTAAAQQWNVPLTEIEAKDSMLTHKPSGRKLTYAEMAAKAAGIRLEKEPAIKTPDQYSTIIGKRVKQLDVELKVHGQATFGIDVRHPNMLYAVSRLSPVIGGKLKSFNFDAIKNRPGVHSAVPLTGLNLSGDGIAVVADSWWRAKSALDVLPVEWDEGPNLSLSSKDMFAAFKTQLNQSGSVTDEAGDYAAAMKGAAKIIEAEYEVPYQSHSPMEPLNATVQLTSERLDIWVGTQGPEGNHAAGVRLTGMPADKVYVHNCFLGGGFSGRGGRGEVDIAIVIAKTLNGRPVKHLRTREEDSRQDRYRPMGVARFQGGLGADGFPVAAYFKVVGNRTSANQVPVGPNKVMVDAQTAWGFQYLPYAIPNRRIEISSPQTPVPVSAWRAPGHVNAAFYIESFIDEMAHAAGKDPYQYRRTLIKNHPGFPGQQTWLEVLDAAAEKSGWGKPLPKGWGRGIAIDDRRKFGVSHNDPELMSAGCVVATVSVSQQGNLRVEKVDVAFDQGYALVNPETVDRQMRGQVIWGMAATMIQEVTVNRGRIVEGNFDDYPQIRIAEAPTEINLNYVKSNRWIAGVGEELVPSIGPAICNAVFAAIGKRIRSLPIRNHDLSWA